MIFTLSNTTFAIMNRDNTPHIAIIGAGPTGLGAAWRLTKLGYRNWSLYERNAYAGGLAASFKDVNGFWWDIGGHVQFSHYPYFDRLMNKLLKNNWLYHERSAHIWIQNRFIPYPFQYNIRQLPRKIMWECLRGVAKSYRENGNLPSYENFERWIVGIFGKGIAEYFMIPYNTKVWATSLKKMGHYWIGDRVAIPNLERMLDNIIHEKDDISWGPNNKFRFPRYGATGEIWRKLASTLPSGKIVYNKELVRVITRNRKLLFRDSTFAHYDILINTSPIDRLVRMSDMVKLKPLSQRLLHNTVTIIGLGMSGKSPPHLNNKCWMYYPEASFPFYRVTVFSNYSPNNVPLNQRYWSLMFEVAESPNEASRPKLLTKKVITAAKKAGLILVKHKIVSCFAHRADYGYPIPSVSRNEHLYPILQALQRKNIYSRGRFGLWKYEVGNQDHSLMQGVECIDYILRGKKETTAWYPSRVNEK